MAHRTSRLFIFAVFLLAGCKAPSYTYTYQEKEPSPAGGQIAFFTFHAEEDSVGTRITLLEKKIVEGTIKQNTPEYTYPDRLHILQLDKNEQPLTSVAIAHPLRQHLELFSSEGHVGSQQVSHKEKDFFLRTQLHAGAVYLRIEEVINNTTVRVTRLTIVS